MTAQSVTARCPSCLSTREIGPGEIPVGDVPMCERCLLPMFVVRAQATPAGEANR